jgi:two-component system capsular synthesis sensor histidine kinase RcsC
MPLRVLVVDDEVLIAIALAEALEAAGHEPIVGLPGVGVLDDLEYLDYDVVVTDLNMPAIDGRAVARWVSRHRPTTPVIAYTAALPHGGTALPGFTAAVSKSAGAAAVCAVVAAIGH